MSNVTLIRNNLFCLLDSIICVLVLQKYSTQIMESSTQTINTPLIIAKARWPMPAQRSWTPPTLRCGSGRRRASLLGSRRGGGVVPAGTSSARPCAAPSLARRSTFTRAASTWSSRTTTTRSPSRRLPSATTTGPTSFCTVAICIYRAARCPSLSRTSSPLRRLWRNTRPGKWFRSRG